jgi:hypothetical protein
MGRKTWSPAVALAALLVPACATRIEPPPFDPQAAGARALADYDRNKDGFLDARELERCPGLKSRLARLDTDRDGRLSQEEIEKLLEGYQGSGIGLMEVVCRVTLGGKPLAGAEVALEPEPFMGDGARPALGTTDERGRARPRVEGAPVRGCHLGVYRVRVSKKDAQGRETVPARYNTQTQLGIEVGPGMEGGYTFHLAPG